MVDAVTTHRRRLLGLGIACGGGSLIGAWVGVEWVTVGVAHEVWTLVAATSLLFGVQLLGFWLLAGLVIATHLGPASDRDHWLGVPGVVT